jgi:hypothetical protein
MSRQPGMRWAATLVVAGIVLSLGPLLGAVWAALRMASEVSAATAAGLEAAEPVLAWRPIAAGFAVFPFGLALLAAAVRRYSGLLRESRSGA